MQQLSLWTDLEDNKSFSFACDCMGVENNTPAWPDRFGLALKKWLEENNEPGIRTLSLFSGAGGLDIGFSDLGFKIINSVEIEEKFCETLELNSGDGKRFSSSTVNCIDIREFSGKDIGPIDFIIGGPPCQTFSAAGRRANGVLGTTDARGVLFREYVRLLKELSPKGFLFENVYGIIGAQNGEAWREILDAFSSVGYKLFYRVVDAADYGVPQHRERLIIVGLKDGNFLFPRPTHGPDSLDSAPFYNAGTAVEGVLSRESERENKLGGRFAHLLNDIPPGLNYSFYTEEMGHPNPVFAWRSKFSDFLYKADPNCPVRTIKASGGAYTGPLSWENRFFTYEEYKRLQTFPDDYEISGKKQIAIKQIGNSVPPQLARIMAIAIRQQVFGTQFPFTLSLLEPNEELSFRKRKRELSAVYKKKAELAIKSLKNKKKELPNSHSYFCTLDKTFRFKESPKEVSNFRINVHWGNNLRIVVEDSDCKDADEVFSINIRARENWTLCVDKVILISKSMDTRSLTAAWKAFERELTTNAIKADLVQLNGYYQYCPKFVCSCTFVDSFLYSNVLKKVIEMDSVPRILSTYELSETWQIEPKDVLPVACFLKSLGYEIRNHKTNPQIGIDDWLIPYAFPTLTPLSVQLWKSLT